MFKTINVRESVEKEVVRFGNGSIVYTPKKWIGKKVLVILEEKPLDVKAEAMELLKQHLSSVEGVFLFGSFARNEQTENSDIDLLVIAGKEIDFKKNGKFDFLVRKKANFVKEMKSDPTLFLHQIVSEAKPILNESLLRELKQAMVEPDFGKFFDDTLGAFKKTKGLLEAGKGKEFLESNAVIYSLMLRLKSLFIIQCYKKNAEFSNKKFKEFIKSHGFSEKTTNNFLEAYQAERDERKARAKVPAIDAGKLFEAAKIEFLKTEMMVKKRAKADSKKQ